MPIYRITAPNGKTYQIEGPPGASDADVAQAVLAQFPDAGKPPAESTITGELVRGAKQLGSSIRTGLESVVSPEEAAIAGIERGKKISEQAGEGPSFAAVRKAYEERGLLPAAGEAISQIPRAVAGQIPQMATMAGGARLGAMAGTAAAPFLGPAAPLAPIVGGVLGAGATLLPQFAGADVERQAQEQLERGQPVDISRTKAYAAAAGQAALEAAGTAFTVGKRIVKGVLGVADDAVLAGAKAQQELAKAAARSLPAAAGRGAVRGTAEIPVEIAQAIIERAQAGLDLTSDEALAEYGENAYLAGLVGPTIGGAAGVVETRGARAKEAAPTPGAEAPIDIAKRQAAEAEAQKAQQQAAIQTEREAKGKEYLDRINELAEQPNAFAQLALYGEELKQEPKSKERDEALRVARNKRLEILTGQVSEERATAEAAKGFMTAEEAAAAQITPREGMEIPEPKVREEAPSNILDVKAVSALGFNRGGRKSVQSKLVGKDLTVPEDALAVRAVLEKYKESERANESNVKKIDAFLAKMPQIVAPEVPSVGETVTEPSGAGVSVAGEPGGVSTPAGVGVTEPTGVVPAVTDVGQPTVGEAAQPSAVVKPAGKRVSLAKQIQGVNLAPQGVPDVALINQTFAQYPQYHNAVLYALGVDSEGHFLDKPLSLKEAAKAAGLGENAHSNLSKVLKQVGLTPEVREMYHAAQAGELAVGRTGVVGGEAKTEAEVGGDFTKRPWYTPIAEKGVGNVNDTELLRAIDNASSAKPTPESKKLLADLIAESKKREKSPSFRQAFNEYTKTYVEPTEETQGETAAPDQVVGEGEEFEIPEIEDTTRRLSDEDDIAELGARPTPGVTSPAITQAAVGGNTTRALQAVTQTPEATPLDHLVAQRFLGLGRFLGLPKIEVVPQDQVKGSGQYDPDTDTIRIAEGQVDTHTVLHETTHGFVHKLIVANERGFRNDEGYRDLKTLYKFLQNKRPDLSNEYGFTNLSEFASESMSNPQFQKKLGQIEYKARSAWSTFVSAVRKLLKLAPGKSSALAESMASVDSLLRVGREYQTKGPSTKAGTASLAPAQVQAQPIGVKEDPGFSGYVARTLGSSKIQGFRAKVADSLAGVDAFFADKYNGKIKDNQGNANPMVLLSRALDSRRFSKVAQEEGTLGVGPDGLTVAKKLAVDASNFTPEDLAKLGLIAGEEVSYLKALSEVPRTGLTKEQVGNLLIGHREYNLRALAKANKIDYEQTLDDATIDKYERQYQASNEVKRISQMLDAVRFSMIDEMVRSGRIDEKTSAEWKDATGYVPFSRIDALDNFYASGAPAKRGAAIYRNLKQISGDRTRQMENPLESFSGLIDWMTNESMKTEAASRALQEMSLFNAAQRIPAREALSNNQQGAIVETYIDGKKALYYVPDPALLGAFSYTQPEVSSIVKGFQKGSRVLRAGVTSMPAFVVKQVVDDITRMYTFAGLQNNREAVGRVLVNFPKNWFNEIMGRKSAGARAMEERGLVGTFDFTDTGNVKNIMAEAGLEKRGFASRALQIMEAGAKASDLAVRQAIYEQVLKETGSVAEAENRAREIINFSRRGNAKIMDTMIRTVPFFNAFARGTDKLLTAAAGGRLGVGESIGQPRAVFWKRMSTLTALATVYALMMSDDDEYNKLPDRVRDRNIILPLNKEFVQKYGVVPGIPLPADLAFIFKAIPERVIQYYRLQGTPEERTMLEISRELMKQGLDIFSTPNVTPQFVRPIFENMINTSFFLDRPLESQMQIANYRPFERYGAGTSDVAKKLAEIGEDIRVRTGVELTAISPIKIENFIRGMLGTIGGTALAVGDALINPSRTDRPLQQQLIPQLTGASTFMKDGVSSRFLDEMYKLERDAEQAFSTHKRLEEKGDLQGAATFLAQNYGIYNARSSIRSLMTEIRDLNKLAMDVDKMTQISPTERRNFITMLKIRQNDFARRAYELRKEAASLQMQMDKELSSKR